MLNEPRQHVSKDGGAAEAFLIVFRVGSGHIVGMAPNFFPPLHALLGTRKLFVAHSKDQLRDSRSGEYGLIYVRAARYQVRRIQFAHWRQC